MRDEQVRVFNTLNLWASAWIDRHVAERALPMNQEVALTSHLENQPEPPPDGVTGVHFTGDEIRTIHPEITIDLVTRRGIRKLAIEPKRVTYAVRFDSSTIGKYSGSHNEKRPLSAVHEAYVHVESWLCGFNPSRSDLGRIALLMRYPTTGANEALGGYRLPSGRRCGIEAHEWVKALAKARPELYDLIAPRYTENLQRLRKNIELALGGSEPATGRVRRLLG